MFQGSFRRENIVLSELYSSSGTEALPENKDFYQSHVSQSEKALSEMKKSQTLRINHEMIPSLSLSYLRVPHLYQARAEIHVDTARG